MEFGAAVRARSADAVPYSEGSQDVAGHSSGILRKKLYDQNLSDWTAKYRKNKQSLESLVKDCEQLRVDVAKHQQEVDERADGYKQLEEHYMNHVQAKYQETRASYEVALQQKSMFQVQISENRKHKAQLIREKKMLTNDYERKHAELMRMAEVHDKLEGQLGQLTQQLGQLTTDRRRMERELDEVQHNLRTNTELADEVTSEMAHVQDGLKDSMPSITPGWASSGRLENSVGQLSVDGSMTPYDGARTPQQFNQI